MELNCSMCGIKLKTNNSYDSYSPRYMQTKMLPICRIDIQKIFNDYEAATKNKYAALYYVAIAFDIPIMREHVKRLPDTELFFNKWINTAIPYSSAPNCHCFLDGNVLKLSDIVPDDITVKGNNDDNEDDELTTISGEKLARPMDRKKWADDNLKVSDVKRLEELYESQVKDKPFIDQTGIHAIRAWSKATLGFEKAMSAGNVKNAESYQKIAETALKSEGLSKTQENPTEIDTLSGAVVAIENFFGPIPDYPTLIQFLSKQLPQIYSYGFTRDIVDQTILDLVNHIRRNDDKADLNALPDDLKVTDELNELLPYDEKPKWEKEMLDLMGIIGDMEGFDSNILKGTEFESPEEE